MREEKEEEEKEEEGEKAAVLSIEGKSNQVMAALIVTSLRTERWLIAHEN